MFCSIIIPTIARPVLARAVKSALEQEFQAQPYEVIVVNDSGKDLPVADWQNDPRVQVVNTQRRERCVTRNTGAALARGRYLLFLDDDDYLLPNALQALWELSQRSPAAWLYGMAQLIDRQGQPIIRLQHGLNGNIFLQAMAGEWIPFQVSLVEARAFFAAGGINPRIQQHEDVDILRRITLREDAAETRETIAVIGMGEAGSTSDHSGGMEQARWSREELLNDPAAFKRLRASARGAAWQGRLARIYLTSLAWNLKRGALWTAISRALYTLASIALATPGWLSPAFWQALSRPYASPTFARGFQAVEDSSSPRLPGGEMPSPENGR